MATAAQVITAALQKILVQASEAPLEADELSGAIFTMNNLMLDYDASGIRLGYTEILTLGDDVTIPVGALRGLIYNLARDLVPEFGGEFSQLAEDIAQSGLKTMRKLGVAITATEFPSTLPIGSGNEDDNVFTSRFYPGLEDQILAETTGCIALETGTRELIA